MEADQEDPQQLVGEGVSVSLTHSPLNVLSTMTSVRSPKAGAIVLFAGTTTRLMLAEKLPLKEC